jgi:diguanylate cyclase (GGDEF)-like protein
MATRRFRAVGAVIEEPAATLASPAALLARMLFHGLTDISQEDGVLARHPGPALLVDVSARVIAANLTGAMLGDILNAGSATDLTSLIVGCIADNAARCENIHIVSAGSKQTFEASVLPVGDGQTALLLCHDLTKTVLHRTALVRARTHERLLRHILRIVRDETEPAGMLAATAAATARSLNADSCLIFRGRDAASFKSAAAFGAVVGPVADVARLLAEAAKMEDPIAQAGWLIAATYYRHEINGAVALWRAGGERAWSEDDQSMLGGVADHLGIAVAQIANHEQLRDLSRTDGLTGLLNRRTFYAELERRWPRACRSGAGALIYCDIDNFKLVNDHFGHANGDETLRRIAEILGTMTRGRDLVARLGGDEFALWLEDADQTGAQRKADGLLTAAAALANLTGDSSRPLAVSLGIAMPDRRDSEPESLEAFLARADAAMYSAKRTGKGRSVLANPPERAVLP